MNEKKIKREPRGRPRKGGALRVNLVARVTPETLATLRRRAKTTGQSLGETLDRLADHLPPV